MREPPEMVPPGYEGTRILSMLVWGGRGGSRSPWPKLLPSQWDNTESQTPLFTDVNWRVCVSRKIDQAVPAQPRVGGGGGAGTRLGREAELSKHGEMPAQGGSAQGRHTQHCPQTNGIVSAATQCQPSPAAWQMATAR